MSSAAKPTSFGMMLDMNVEGSAKPLMSGPISLCQPFIVEGHLIPPLRVTLFRQVILA